MYQTFYHLSADPFRLSPNHRLCYQHPSFKKAGAYMQYALQRAEGFVMVTGRPGTGKTTLINGLLASLDSATYCVARLATTQLRGQDFLRAVAYAFNLSAEGVDQATLLRNLERFFIQRHDAGQRVLLIVDEAQDLHESALTELRLLSNTQRAGGLLLQAFLVGQESLTSLVRGRDMQQFHQRIIAACHLDPLDLEQTRAYVLHRLKVTGWSNDPQLSEDVFSAIYQFSQGVPRQINLVCSRLLLHGWAEEKHALDVRDAQEVLQGLRQEQLVPFDAVLDEFELEPSGAPDSQFEASGDQSPVRGENRPSDGPSQVTDRGKDRSPAHDVSGEQGRNTDATLDPAREGSVSAVVSSFEIAGQPSPEWTQNVKPIRPDLNQVPATTHDRAQRSFESPISSTIEEHGNLAVRTEVKATPEETRS